MPLTEFEAGFEVKEMFFTAQKVLDRIGVAEARTLSKFGAFVRRRARSIIRPGGQKGKISQPGEPPRTHAPEPNIETIFFWYDPLTHSVIVGPVALNHKPTTSLVRGVIPKALEQGGQLDLVETLIGDRWYVGRARGKRQRPTRVRTVTIAARPFMRPALEHEIGGFPDLWAGSVRDNA